MSTEHLTTPNTLQEAIQFFSDEDRCISYLVAQRWPNGVLCPICGSSQVTYLKNQRRWKCSVAHERRQFSVKVGTLMEDSPISLTKWLPAMWLIGNCKNGISSYEIARDIDVTQKTAWFMLHRVRMAMHDGESDKFAGHVEADETLIGGQARFMHKDRKERTLKKGRGSAGKTVVMGLLQRHSSDAKKQKIIDTLDQNPKKDKKASRVKLSVIPTTKTEVVQKQVRDNVTSGSTVYTDELASYKGLAPEYVHEVINHAEAYVQGNVHTNGMENFWSLLKRMVKGTYVSVEPFHLFRYLDEEAFRFNERKLTDSERFAKVTSSLADKRLTYKHLTGKDLPEPSLA